MKPVNFSSGMRMAPPLESPLLDQSTTLRLDVNLNSFQLHHNGRCPRFPQIHLRTSAISQSPRVCNVNLHVRTPVAFLVLPIYTGSSLAETPQQPLPPPRKLWYDKLADALLGDDDSSANAPASRYALICQKCLAHNGLVKEEMWEDTRTHNLLLLACQVDVKGYHFCWTEYVCPKCGYFNPSARSQRKGVQVQPQTSTTQTPRQPESRDSSSQSAARAPRNINGSPELGGSTAETDS